MLTRLYGFVSCLANDIHRHLVDWFARDPIDLFRRRVETVNFYVTHRLTTKDNMREQYPTDWAIRSAAKVMALLFAANGLRRHEKLSVHEFYNTMVDYVDYFRDFQRWQEQSGMFAFCQYPFLISLGVKMQIMEMDAKRTMAEKIREAFWIQTFHGILTDPFLSIHVRRDHLIEDSLNQLQQVRPLELKKRLKIEFANEDGVDAGGLSKEWFLLLTRDLFDPQFGMWTYDDESHYCWFSQFSFDSAKEEYRLLGIVLGLAIFNNVIIPCPLPLACYKKLLNIPVDLDDLKVLRPSLGKGLQQLLDYTGNDVQDVFLRDFVVEVESFGEIQTVELIPNGRNRPVTSENKEEYVRLYVDWIFNRSVHTQFESFRAGFDTVCKGSPLTLFKPEELEMVVRGDEEIDIAALQSVTEYEGFDPREPTVRWFWEVAKSYSEEDKKKLLSFVTGSDRVSPTGIQTMQFKLTCLGNDSDRLPQSHTCFNQLGLYRYTSKEKLAWKLKTAIIDSSGFGLK
ncbi:HECT-domain-containing protein [Gonapodya prolifera JEL478]|uniref:HECT-type E3 ubiquitin transferase n=1 Tax=Gonapodya prolifera (strain JEL478) TaxID=1344416 RepID=A0A139AL88_GONPJ|nr:HECT-domain-containing protein [Gonapodya prolifera JEL478]|eukprot:KXS17549.1 HECT-domain-containing protein [Gonapodya prolifera JEL478]